MSSLGSVRAEAAAQIVLMLCVGSVAACASWSHVVDLAARHGQPGWLAVADSAVLETMAVSMGLEVRRRRRTGERVRFAAVVLVAAVALQLAAQVAQAPRSFWGWTMAALPAVGFLLLAKSAITRGASLAPAEGRVSVGAVPTETAPTETADVELPAEGDRVVCTPVADLTDRATIGPNAARQLRPTAASPRATDAAVMSMAHEIAAAFNGSGRPLTRASLAAQLRSNGVQIGTSRVGELLAELRAEGSTGRGRHKLPVSIATSDAPPEEVAV